MTTYSTHARLPRPFTAVITSPEIGTGEPLPVEVIAVSCYTGEQVTFWVRGAGGWLYCYAPQQWLSAAVCTYRCPTTFAGFTVDPAPVSVVKVQGSVAEPVAIIDFLDANEALWVLRTQSGVLVAPHRAFDAEPPVGGLRKCWNTWK